MSDDFALRVSALDLLGQIRSGVVTRSAEIHDDLLFTYQALFDRGWVSWSQEAPGEPVYVEITEPGEAAYSRLRAEMAKALDKPQEPLRTMTHEPAAADADEKAWISATQALIELTFLKGRLPALYKYAKENPGKLRLRPHPHHQRRRQANAADVLRLKQEYDKKAFEEMDSPAADALPSLSADGLQNLAKRVQQIKTERRNK